LVPQGVTTTKIFAFTPNPQWNIPKATVLPLLISDSENGTSVNAAFTMNSLSFKDLPLRYDYVGANRVSGIALPDTGSFYFEAEAKGFMPKGGMVKISEGKNDTLKVKLDKIKKGAIARFNNILFASGSADLLPEAEPELGALYKLLKENEQVKIRIDGHTDDIGEAAANLNLSKLRATAVQAYLAKQGIPKDRMQVQFFGESKPLGSNTTEEGKRLNRRIEILIL
jgi:outer membrane protein OmpA-like peptidoglycan-associated protein